ncbi:MULTISPECIES: DivIVA domain-containing protein [Corynebacterium]|uniref:DivIVA domain-containing protein n=1 Tax=Corynebacterium TaxID=1716 RepID=UPI0008860E03|nr:MULTISPECIES: DivIVA domain-containing protein [Corynebacterium]MCG7456398.1 DivIVA domain-containing protein [Corynebacterium sp. ACRPH]SCX19325.1 DivIVA domain protein [Corynebacterium jeikeium]
MFWLLSLVGAFLVGALLVYLLGTVFGRGEALPPVTAGNAKLQHWENLENSPLTAEGIRDIGFSLEIRGYNQAEVDFYIDRLAGRIEELEQQVGGAANAAEDHAAEVHAVETVTTETNTVETDVADTREQER